MRALVQRVSRASVDVAGERVGEIGPGLLVLLGVTHGDTVAAASVLPALFAAWTTRLALPYAWTLAGVQAALALVALGCASHLLQRGWWRTTAIPACVAALAGLGAGWLLPLGGQRPAIELAIHALVFVVAGALSLRILFGAVLERLIMRMPAAHRVRAIFLFPKVRAEALSSTPVVP